MVVLKKIGGGIILTACLLLVIVSCKKEIGSVGLDLQPDDELLNTIFFDTATIQAYSTYHFDSIATNGVMYNMLGYLNDPIFGTVQAGFYAQCRLSTCGADFGANPVVDSLVLQLVYTLPYGDTLQPFRVHVYELQEDLKYGTTYYSNTSLQTDGEDLVDGTYDAYPRPKTITDTSINAPVFRIPLKKSFAENKFVSRSKGNEFNSNAAFLEYFKGLYVVADLVQGDGSIVSVSLTNDNSALTMYYHDANDPSTALKYRMVISDSSVRVGTINHKDYAEAEQELQDQLHGDYTSTTEKLYVQTGLGVKTIVSFPNIKQQFEGKKIIVHRAELVMTRMNNTDTTQYGIPSSVYLTRLDSTTMKPTYVADYYVYLGGAYDSKKDEYRIRVTKHLQYLIEGTSTANDVSLILTAAATRMNRVVFYGTNPASLSSKRMRLEMYYTEIEQK